MLTVSFYADSNGFLSMVTQHEAIRGIPQFCDISSELHTFYSYFQAEYGYVTYLRIGRYDICIHYESFREMKVSLLSDEEFGTYLCNCCSFVCTPNEVVMYLSFDNGKRKRKQLILR